MWQVLPKLGPKAFTEARKKLNNNWSMTDVEWT